MQQRLQKPVARKAYSCKKACNIYTFEAELKKKERKQYSKTSYYWLSYVINTVMTASL